MATILNYQKKDARSLLAEALRASEAALRAQADIIAILALEAEGGSPSDWLRPADVQKIINCGESKARQIVRAHGSGSGKMGRIQRGKLIELLQNCEL